MRNNAEPSFSQVCKTVEPSIDGELEYYEIPGQHLEPSTTYVVSVRSYTNWSGKYSDSSEEREFTTGECHLYSLLSLLKQYTLKVSSCTVMKGDPHNRAIKSAHFATILYKHIKHTVTLF